MTTVSRVATCVGCLTLAGLGLPDRAWSAPPAAPSLAVCLEQLHDADAPLAKGEVAKGYAWKKDTKSFAKVSRCFDEAAKAEPAKPDAPKGETKYPEWVMKGSGAYGDGAAQAAFGVGTVVFTKGLEPPWPEQVIPCAGRAVIEAAKILDAVDALLNKKDDTAAVAVESDITIKVDRTFGQLKVSSVIKDSFLGPKGKEMQAVEVDQRLKLPADVIGMAELHDTMSSMTTSDMSSSSEDQKITGTKGKKAGDAEKFLRFLAGQGLLVTALWVHDDGTLYCQARAGLTDAQKKVASGVK